jgi:hypothetical protein
MEEEDALNTYYNPSEEESISYAYYEPPTLENFVINQSVDQLLENLPITSVSKAIANNLYGINYLQTPTMVPSSRNVYGFTFFTRPQLNLSIYNISNYTPFYSLLTTNPLSIQRYTRLMLDPRLAFRGLHQTQTGLDFKSSSEPNLTCPFVNPYNPFIPIFTNNLVSISGWPDLTVPVYTSNSGLYGEEFSAVDGVTNNFEAFDVDVTFRNTRGDPIIYMIYIWIKYMSLVFEGVLNPYLDFIAENELDYNTRIYRIVLDNTKRKVTYIACTGASFPLNVPSGNLFDYSNDGVYNTKNSEFSVRFRSNGFLAFEDIIKYEFNEINGIYNPDFYKLLQHDIDVNTSLDEVERLDQNYVYEVGNLIKIPFATMMNPVLFDNKLMNQFHSLSFRATPWINLYTNELEWWISRDLVDGLLLQSGQTFPTFGA